MTNEKPFGSTSQLDAPASGTPDNLVPDPVVCAEFGVTAMTLWRWTRDPVLGFPPVVNIRGRNFRSRKQLEDFKASLLQQAIRQRRQATEA
jgi:hypothetical protein